MSDGTPQRPNDDPGGEPSGFGKFMKVVAYLFVGAIVLVVLAFGTCFLMFYH